MSRSGKNRRESVKEEKSGVSANGFAQRKVVALRGKRIRHAEGEKGGFGEGGSMTSEKRGQFKGKVKCALAGSGGLNLARPFINMGKFGNL